MKKNFLNVFAVSIVVFMLSAIAFAQGNRSVSAAGNLYVISANAGGVNYVEGKVSVTQNNGRNGYLLKGDRLEIGEKVVTGADGKAEILLNPGSYLRLSENSSFEFATTSLDDLQLKLNRGSAIFEVITSNDFTFAVNTPKGQFYITESGVYRVDILSDGNGRIEVWRGKAHIGDKNATIVKSGRAATVNGSQVTVEKFDRDEKDALETWSKIRAKELAKANSRLQRNDLRNTLVNSFNRRGWNLYDSYGLWVLDSFSAEYCFLPFGYGWNSPYGYGFGRDIWYLRLPRVIYNQPPPYQPPLNQTPQAGILNSGVNGKIRNNNPTNSEPAIPPFQRVQRDIGQFPAEQRDTPNTFNDFQRFPTSVPAQQQSSPVLSSPTSAPVRKGDN